MVIIYTDNSKLSCQKAIAWLNEQKIEYRRRHNDPLCTPTTIRCESWRQSKTRTNGTTGNSTNPHLHLEMSRDASQAQSQLIDLASVLDLK